MKEIFKRTESLIGTENLEKLIKSKVAIFGIGGVGSFAVEGLVRAGIGEIVLIDKDTVDITNCNRQIHATTKTIGKLKVEAMKERVIEINPEIKVTYYNEFYLPDNGETLIDSSYSYIIDAMDNVTAKISLIRQSIKKNIPIISCMGTGNKIEPTKLKVEDISKTSICPLA